MWQRNRMIGMSGWVACVTLCIIGLGNARAAEPIALPAATPAFRQFAIGKEGRVILLPMRVGHREILCLVDTGASHCSFDISLKHALGVSRGTRTSTTPAGTVRLETFDWPEVNLGGEVLKTDRPVACLDLTEIRQATNAKIYGMLGMDVLKDRRVQIDFDRGELRFLDALSKLPENLGQRIPIELAPNNLAYLLGTIGAGKQEWFLIDTGTQEQFLAEDVFNKMRARKLIHVGGSFTNVTVGGMSEGDCGQLESFSIGPFTHQGLRFSPMKVSSLGLRYFSRFRVTFDFPGKCAYLQAGEHCSRSEQRATSGLALLWKDGEAVVHSVKKDGPGATAGLRVNDVLVKINGEDAAAFDQFSLWRILTSVPGRKVQMKIRRGDHSFDADVVLQEN